MEFDGFCYRNEDSLQDCQQSAHHGSNEYPTLPVSSSHNTVSIRNSDISTLRKPGPPPYSRIGSVCREEIKLIVMENLPFNIFDKTNGRPSEHARLLEKACPGIMRSLPDSKLLSDNFLDEFYKEAQEKGFNYLNETMASSYGGIIFEGWENINSGSIVSVFLPTESVNSWTDNVFFLNSYSPGHRTLDAEMYVSIIKGVIEKTALNGKYVLSHVTTPDL